MDDVTRILKAVERGDAEAAEQLLPLAYDELRRIAAGKIAAERGDHTLQATALVHEAYIRLAGPGGEGNHWNSRAHFFAAAAEAMRRVLIDSARRKATAKRGGGQFRTEFDESKINAGMPSDEILAVNEALKKLEEEDPGLANIVKLRYFAGMTVPETAAALEVSPSTVNRAWRCARAWLYREISESG